MSETNTCKGRLVMNVKLVACMVMDRLHVVLSEAVHPARDNVLDTSACWQHMISKPFHEHSAHCTLYIYMCVYSTMLVVASCDPCLNCNTDKQHSCLQSVVHTVLYHILFLYCYS